MCAEYGSGAPVLLLHGLAGYGGEWQDTVRWLAESNRAVVVDQRGHGASPDGQPMCRARRTSATQWRS